MKLKYLVFIFFLSAVAGAQEIDTTNTDEILQKAIELYQNQDYSTSLKWTVKGLELAPGYHDIRIFQIRNNFALNNIMSVDKDLQYITEIAADYPDVQNLVYKRINVEKNAQEKLGLIDHYSIVYPKDLHLSTLKAEVLLEEKQIKPARELALELFNDKNLTDGDRYVLQNILKRTSTDEIALNYQVISFQGDYPRKNPWHNLSLEYQHNFNQTAVISRINFSDRSYTEGVFYEIEAYPVFSNKFYGFVNFGFSKDEIFPELRATSSLFYNFAQRFEAEAGVRWEKRNETDFFSGIIGMTAYVNKFYLNVRSNFGPVRADKLVQNYQFNLRYYLKNPDNYLIFSMGTGISPEEINIYSAVLDNPTLQAFYSNFGIRKTFSFHHVVQLTGGVLVEEIGNNRKGNQFLGGVNYRYRF